MQNLAEHLIAQTHDDVLSDPFDEVFAEEEAKAAQDDKQQQSSEQEHGQDAVVGEVAGIPLADPLRGGLVQAGLRAAKNMDHAAAGGAEDTEDRSTKKHAE